LLASESVEREGFSLLLGDSLRRNLPKADFGEVELGFSSIAIEEEEEEEEDDPASCLVFMMKPGM
jgi:hypothetical protein